MKDISPIRVLAVSVCAGLACAAFGGAAQTSEDFTVADPGAPGTPEELRAFSFVRQNELVRAREAAQAIIREHPDSYVGHFVLGWAHHYAEANFPMALFHENEALRLFEAANGSEPRPGGAWPWQWHARLLREISTIHGDLENYEERLGYIERYNEFYQPKIVAERAWPLMKMRRFDAARAAAREGIGSGDPFQMEVGLNALCAVEFEAGDDQASYAACRAALEYARQTNGTPNSVDLTNFAEASRSLFKLDEAERILLEATEATPAWYGNPWLELGELYTRGARFPEALSALEKVPAYRAARPPHVRDADRNESRRALAAFFLVVGEAQAALDITEKALVMPDRRAHNSRDPAQDRAVIALLDRRARRVVAERAREATVAAPWYSRLRSFADATLLRFEGWLSGRQAVRLLADDERLVGTFRVGMSSAAIVPPWLVGELADVAGPGVVDVAADRAQAGDERAGAGAYYDAFRCEAAVARGDEARAIELAERALAALGPGDALLGARVEALRARAMRAEHGTALAMPAFEAAVQRDPGVFRRLEIALPVRIEAGGGEIAEAIVDALERSPRLVEDDAGFILRVRGDATRGEVCLMGASQTVLDCGDATPAPSDSPDDLAGKVVQAFHDVAFAPRIDLSQADINSLDGSTRTSRDPLESLRGR